MFAAIFIFIGVSLQMDRKDDDKSGQEETKEDSSPPPDSPISCPYQSSSKDGRNTKQEEPRLHTEGVSEYLTHYERTGYTEDSLRQFVVLDDIESKGKKRKREAEDGEEEGEGEEEDEDSEEEDEDQDESNDSADSYYGETDHSDVCDDEIEKMLEEG